ncbi:transcriptional regulator GntR family [Eubacterium sp. CAG:156]|jgi:GntR family transcriptional regulator/MocR family aminotransferase|nr:transcriptional regulator GntR family [Eubacterium sp. CAG:156]
MPAARRHQLLEWANMGERYIIEDDYDSEFRFSGKPIPTMASIDKNQKVIYMNTFSKTLAPSIRIAYMVLPFELMDKYTKKLDFYSSTVSSFEQYTLAEFIKGGYYERHINRMRNYYKDSRNKIITAIRNSSIYPQISIEEENSGLHFILRIKKNIDDENFKKYLKDKLINISCLTDYCYQYDDEVINEKFRKEFSHKFIINYSEVEESKMVEALKIIEQALKFTAEKDT